MSISQLDLVLLGNRALTSRIGSLEGDLSSALRGGFGGVQSTFDGGTRANLLLNSSFEFYNRNATVVQDWQQSIGATLNASAVDADGTATLMLAPGATAQQLVAAGQSFVAGAFVLSVAVRSMLAGQTVTLAVDHTPGVQLGAIHRLSTDFGVAVNDQTPGGNDWFRFYVQGLLVGGGTVTIRIGNAGGSASNIEIDAAKFEFVAGQTGFIEPTAFIGSDWGSSTIVRNLTADNIVAGTLEVGGSNSDNPVIRVLDSNDTEIVSVGDPANGYYGVEVKGLAGIRIMGGGSLDVNDSGDINITDGDLNVTGLGSINVTGTGGIDINSGGGLRVNTGGDIVINDGGNFTVDGGGDITVTDGGNIYVNNGGGVNISGDLQVYGTSLLGGDLTLDGSLLMGTTGLFRIGNETGKRLVWAASGMEAYDASDNRRMFLDVDTATWRFFGENAVVLEGDGSISAGTLAWVDAAGFWATDALGNAAFGVSGLDAHLWGGLTLDAGDVLLGDSNSYVWWDASDDKIKMSGILTAADGQVLIGDMGLSLAAGGNNANQLKWETTPGDMSTVVGAMYTYSGGFISETGLVIGAEGEQATAGWKTRVNIEALGSNTSAWARLLMEVTEGTPTDSRFQFYINNLEKVKIHSDGISVLGTNLLNIDTLNLGHHPNYDLAAFSGIWRTGRDYGVLFSDNDTYINAPLATGAVYIRAANSHIARFDWNGNFTSKGSFFPGNQETYYLGWDGGTSLYTNGNLRVAGNIYPSNGGTYYWAVSGSAEMVTNAHLKTQARLYIGNQSTRYFYADANYTRYNSNFVVDGDLYANGRWFSAYIDQPVLSTSDVVFQTVKAGTYNATGGGSIFGNILTNYTPTSGNWTSATTLIVQGYDWSSIGFHDASNRVDFITCVNGTMTLGYNGGWGSAAISIPNTLAVSGNVGIGSAVGTAYRLLVLGVDQSSSNGPAAFRNSANSNVMYLLNNGATWAASAWVYSDGRAKRGIRDTDRGLEHVKQLKPKRYTKFLDETTGGLEEQGFIAQELQAIMPELVMECEPREGETGLAVNYNGVVAVLVRAIQELTAKVEALEKKPGK